jgi:uncharacterized protein (TIGR03382 family)
VSSGLPNSTLSFKVAFCIQGSCGATAKPPPAAVPLMLVAVVVLLVRSRSPTSAPLQPCVYRVSANCVCADVVRYSSASTLCQQCMCKSIATHMRGIALQSCRPAKYGVTSEQAMCRKCDRCCGVCQIALAGDCSSSSHCLTQSKLQEHNTSVVALALQLLAHCHDRHANEQY